MDYQILKGLQPEDYEYELDRTALESLRNFPDLARATNFVLNWTDIRWRQIELCGSRLHCSPYSLPELYSSIINVVETLDISHMPDVYIEWGYFINAYTTGLDENAILCLFSGTVDLLTHEEQRFVIGHELGHQKSGHVLYHVMVSQVATMIESLGIPKSLAKTFTWSLYYWYRMSEFTADRAGLLACQDINAALSAMMKMAGLPKSYYETAKVDGFIKQAHEFQKRYSSGIDTFIKSWEIMDDSHPWTVLRAAELLRWVESGEYQKILDKYKTKKCAECGKQVALSSKCCPFCGSTSFE